MPQRPSLPCTYPGCSGLSTDGKRGCPEHRKGFTWKKNSAVYTTDDRVRGTRLQERRARLFQEQPLCVNCLKQDRVTIAVIRDHIIPLAEGGLDVEENTQPLCRECHALKTAEESKRGVQRAELA